MLKVHPLATRLAAVACVTTLFTAHAAAQSNQQKISGPQARYWLSAETATGMGAVASGGGGGGLGAVMGSMFGGGGGGGPSKTLRLDLGAQRDASPASGQHAIPAGMSMGASLPLTGPERTEYEKRERMEERDVPEYEERGNMRMLFFWGCGAEAGPGQPVIFDMKQMQQGRLPANLRTAVVRDRTRAPGYGRDRGYADWPNPQNNTRVPAQASLTGDHAVSSNIANDIRFSVPAANDFLGGLQLSSSANPAGGSKLSWNNLERALGYAATSMGMRETAPQQTDMVLWTSSAQRMLGGQELMGFLPPAEVQRLINDRVAMPAGTTECVIPKQALEAAGGQMLMSSLNAFGPELNHIHPPRPSDPRAEWKQEYAVKLRTRSHTTMIDGMGGRPSRGSSTQQAGQPAGQPAGQEGEQKPGLPGVGNVLRGIFGR
jgi:hypothetical protein